ncbi:hypothetical protein LINPERHAP2_LOCUS37477 [Linum perenne]
MKSFKKGSSGIFAGSVVEKVLYPFAQTTLSTLPCALQHSLCWKWRICLILEENNSLPYLGNPP